MKTKQEIFDIAARGVIGQRGFSVREDGTCRYRAHGMKCAVGHMIPDEDYDPNFDVYFVSIKDVLEDKRDYDEVRRGGVVDKFHGVLMKHGLSDGSSESLKFLQDLQYAHDNASVSVSAPVTLMPLTQNRGGIANYINRMHIIAEEYNLNTDALRLN